MSYTDEDARRWSEHVKIWDVSPAADGFMSAAQHTPEEVVRQVAECSQDAARAAAIAREHARPAAGTDQPREGA